MTSIQANKQKAEAALQDVEKVTKAVLAEPSNALVTLQEADAPASDQIKKRMAELDMSDTQSIISFGSNAQTELQQISQSMLTACAAS